MLNIRLLTWATIVAASVACTAPLGGRESATESVSPQDNRAPTIDHLSPRRDSTGPLPARFEWTAVKGADRYEIALWNDIDVLLWRGSHLETTSVERPSQLDLEAGTYFWMVSAFDGDRPLAQSGRAAFVVLR